MILEAAVINLTRNLDILINQSSSGTSNDKLKQEALTCLLHLLENAPLVECRNLFAAEACDILLGYTLNVLCRLAKDDKSRSIKSQALDNILALTRLVERWHDIPQDEVKCAANITITALPGVCSTLLRLAMSDTKLPKKLLVLCVRCLNSFLGVSFKPCGHIDNQLHKLDTDCDDKKEDNLFDNLSMRLKLFLYYVMNNGDLLPDEMRQELIGLCETLVTRTRIPLLNRVLPVVVRFVVYVSSITQFSRNKSVENQLKTMILMDIIKSRIMECGNSAHPEADLESVVIDSLLKLLDNLTENHQTMLVGERKSELALMDGLLSLLPNETITNLFEIEEQRMKVWSLLIGLVCFETDQTFLCVTESSVDINALEPSKKNIYSIRKRHKNLGQDESNIVINCCKTIGEHTELPVLMDLIEKQINEFSTAEVLFIVHHILTGVMLRTDTDTKHASFALQTVTTYLERGHEFVTDINESLESSDHANSSDILMVVIATETIVILVELYVRLTSEDKQVVILRDLLCTLLMWASSSCRAISEAALSSLYGISQLYSLDSIKTLIESNLDYIVEGVVKLMNNFGHNTQITNVIAMTFKLSSMKSFYYFKDVYERVFKLLSAYYNSDKSISISMLFFRTLNILVEWKRCNESTPSQIITLEDPLSSESSVRKICDELSFRLRIAKIEQHIKLGKDIELQMSNDSKVTEADEKLVAEEIASGSLEKLMKLEQKYEDISGDKKENENTPQDSDDGDTKIPKPVEVELVEKILANCVHLISSDYTDSKILALKSAACGIEFLADQEETLLPLVHRLWTPLLCRLNRDHQARDIEINLCAFECLAAMALYSKDFIKKRALDTIMPKICVFLESQLPHSRGQLEHGAYCMTTAYKCQLRILTHLGAMAYNMDFHGDVLWRIIKTNLMYLERDQVIALREASRTSLRYLIALDADCVWCYALRAGKLNELPFELIYEHIQPAA